jgi:hypothetical protein
MPRQFFVDDHPKIVIGPRFPLEQRLGHLVGELDRLPTSAGDSSATSHANTNYLCGLAVKSIR